MLQIALSAVLMLGLAACGRGVEQGERTGREPAKPSPAAYVRNGVMIDPEAPADMGYVQGIMAATVADYTPCYGASPPAPQARIGALGRAPNAPPGAAPAPIASPSAPTSTDASTASAAWLVQCVYEVMGREGRAAGDRITADQSALRIGTLTASAAFRAVAERSRAALERMQARDQALTAARTPQASVVPEGAAPLAATPVPPTVAGATPTPPVVSRPLTPSTPPARPAARSGRDSGAPAVR